MSAGAGEEVGEGASEGEKAECSYCGTHDAQRLCTGCLSTRYCGAGCQQKDWKKRHRTACPKDRSLEPPKEHAPAEPRDCPHAQLPQDANEAPAEGPAEQLGALSENDPAQHDQESAPEHLDEPDAPAEKPAQPQAPLSNDEPLYEGTYREILQARAHCKHDGGYAADLAMTKSLMRDGQRARDKGEYGYAAERLVRALEMSMYLGEVGLMANCYRIIGVIFSLQGKLDMVLQTFKEAIRLHRAMGNDDSVVLLLNDMSIVYLKRGEHQESLAGLKGALALIRKEHSAVDHPWLENVLSNLALVYEKQHEHSHALETVQELLRIRTKKLGREHPLVLKTCYRVASMFEEHGESSKALGLLQEHLKIITKTRGKDHLIVGEALYEIGCVYEGQDKYLEAKESFMESLRIAKETQGEQHADVGSILNCLGIVALRLGDDDEAVQHLEQALKILSKAHGESASASALCEIAKVHMNIAFAHTRKGSYKTAKEHFGAAAKIFTRVHGPRHSETQNAVAKALFCARKT